MSKVLDEFSKKHGDVIEVKILNARDNAEMSRLYQVRYVPTLVFLDKDGKMIDKRVGYMPLDALEKHWVALGCELAGIEK